MKKVIFQIFTKFRPDFSKIQILKNYIKTFSVQKKRIFGLGIRKKVFWGRYFYKYPNCWPIWDNMICTHSAHKKNLVKNFEIFQKLPQKFRVICTFWVLVIKSIFIRKMFQVYMSNFQNWYMGPITSGEKWQKHYSNQGGRKITTALLFSRPSRGRQAP